MTCETNCILYTFTRFSRELAQPCFKPFKQRWQEKNVAATSSKIQPLKQTLTRLETYEKRLNCVSLKMSSTVFCAQL